MRADWKRFLLPMLGLLGFLCGFTAFSYDQLGSVFWDAFYPKFLATVFGVVLSIIAAYVIWLYQQSRQEKQKRERLLTDLKHEFAENYKRLEEAENFVNAGSKEQYAQVLRGLRTIAIKHLLESENLVLLKNIQLEDEMDWLLGHIARYNGMMDELMKHMSRSIDSGIKMAQVRSEVGSRLLMEYPFRFLKEYFKDLISRDLDRYRQT